jgi:hypothetical protein
MKYNLKLRILEPNVAVYFSVARSLQNNKNTRPVMPTINKVHPRRGHEGPEEE